VAELVGKVSRRVFGKGSKSEHEALYIDTDQGRYVLRRQGGNAMYDPALQELAGKTIKCTGIVHDYVLLISDWTVMKE
jgi:hypothetical protein